MPTDAAKFLKNHFTKEEIEIMSEALDAYDRYVGGTKSKRFYANRLHQIFALARNK